MKCAPLSHKADDTGLNPPGTPRSTDYRQDIMVANKINFITQAHEGESHVVICSASTLEKLYPNSTFYIYDGGLTEETRETLRSFDTTELVDWREESRFSRLKNVPAEIESKIKNDKYLNHLAREVLSVNLKYVTARRDFLVRQKPRSILDVTESISENLVWLDADVVLINRINEVFDLEFDVGATARSRLEEMSSAYGPINSGVLFFKTDSETIESFTREWLQTIERRELAPNREQEAVADLFERSNEQIFDEYYEIGNLDLSGTSIRTRTFPCDRYNHYNFEYGVHPDQNQILHFKADKSEQWRAMIDDIREGDLSQWSRKPVENNPIFTP